MYFTFFLYILFFETFLFSWSEPAIVVSGPAAAAAAAPGPLADGGLLVVAGDVVPHHAVRVEVVEDADAELGLAVVAELVAVVRLRALPAAGK